MRSIAARCLLGSAILGACLAMPASAHPLDVAFMDIGKNADGSLKMTVAVHPYQAFELVRAGSSARFDLAKLQKNGDLISAYIQDHVQITRGGSECAWDAASAHTPPTEIEALGDGVTIAGPLSCAASSPEIRVRSSLFIEEFPQQTTIVRLELPDGFADRLTLDKSTREGSVSVQEFVDAGHPVGNATSTERRPDAPEVDIAKKFLDPGLGWWGAIGVLLAAMVVGALHALGPGHGKSLIAASLVGQRATIRNVLALGTVMTLTHVSDVIVMAVLAGFVSAVLPPTQLLNALQVVSAAALVAFGVWNLFRAIMRYRLVKNSRSFAVEDEAHRRAHELGMPHTHEQKHEHAPESFRRILWLGFVGSLAPCPTAWAIFLATVSAGRIGAGLLLLVAFTIGLYATILAIGILVVTSAAYAARRTPPQITYALPVASAAVIAGLGVWLLWRAL